MMVSIDESTNELKLHLGEGVDIDKPGAEKINEWYETTCT